LSAPLAPPAAKQQGRRRPFWLPILLLIAVVLGGILYIGAGTLGVPLPGFRAHHQGPTVTTPLNLTITYASVDFTIQNVQQAPGFPDDPQPDVDGMLRIHLLEANTTDLRVVYNLYTSAHLLVPGQGEEAPLAVKVNAALAPHSSRSNILDFAVSTDIKPNRLTLRLGSASEAQMDIPLAAGADLTRYRPRSVSLNKPLNYFGLNWTLTSASESWSAQGQQAPRGQEFLTLTLAVTNTLAQTAITGSPYDYIRLQTGRQTLVPSYTTLPVAFAQGISGTAGSVTFSVPQQSTSFTLTLVAQPASGMESASVDFQLAH
jgi:hypothetical protein